MPMKQDLSKTRYQRLQDHIERKQDIDEPWSPDSPGGLRVLEGDEQLLDDDDDLETALDRVILSAKRAPDDLEDWERMLTEQQNALLRETWEPGPIDCIKDKKGYVRAVWRGPLRGRRRRRLEDDEDDEDAEAAAAAAELAAQQAVERSVTGGPTAGASPFTIIEIMCNSLAHFSINTISINIHWPMSWYWMFAWLKFPDLLQVPDVVNELMFETVLSIWMTLLMPILGMVFFGYPRKTNDFFMCLKPPAQLFPDEEWRLRDMEYKALQNFEHRYIDEWATTFAHLFILIAALIFIPTFFCEFLAIAGLWGGAMQDRQLAVFKVFVTAALLVAGLMSFVLLGLLIERVVWASEVGDSVSNAKRKRAWVTIRMIRLKALQFMYLQV